MTTVAVDILPVAFSEQLRAQTRPRAGWVGRLREASAERTVLVDTPPDQALRHVWDITSIERCERKADHVTVQPALPWSGRYVIRGRVFGVVPWQGEFSYVLHERGFHSEDVGRRRGGLRITGGFTVEPHGDRSRIWHYERYLLPWLVAPFKPAIAAYVRWTQRSEMSALAALITSASSIDGRRTPTSRRRS